MTGKERELQFGRATIGSTTRTILTYASLVAAGVLALAAPAAAQLSTTTTAPMAPPVTETKLIEWDVTPFGDLVPGALASTIAAVLAARRCGSRPESAKRASIG